MHWILTGLWTLLAGLLSTILGYRLGTRSYEEIQAVSNEIARQQQTYWNAYVNSIQELALVRMNFASEPPIVDGSSACLTPGQLRIQATYCSTLQEAKILGEIIGNYFCSIASETLQNLLKQNVILLDQCFVQIMSGQNSTSTVDLLYTNQRQFAAYLSNISPIFQYYPLAINMKQLLDKILNLPVDRNHSGSSMDSTNISMLCSQTSSVANYFGHTLIKYQNLRKTLLKK
jgi:hypothetical protein